MSTECPVHNRKVPGNTSLQLQAPFRDWDPASHQDLKHPHGDGQKPSLTTAHPEHNHRPMFSLGDTVSGPAAWQQHCIPQLIRRGWWNWCAWGFSLIYVLLLYTSCLPSPAHTYTHTHTHTYTHAVYTWGSLWLLGFLIKKVGQYLRKPYRIKCTVQNLRASPGPRASQECDPRLRTHSHWDSFSREASSAGWNVLSCH